MKMHLWWRHLKYFRCVIWLIFNFSLESKRNLRRSQAGVAFPKVIAGITVCQRCNGDLRQHSDGLADRTRQSWWPERERDRNHVTVESRGKRDNMLGERQNKKLLKDRLRKREWNRPESWEAERKTERLHENWGGLFRTWGEVLFKLSMTLSHKERFFNEFGSKLSRWSEVETKSRAYNQVQHHNRQSNPWV